MKKRLFKLLSLAMAAVILLSVALPTVSATSGNIDPDIIAETIKTNAMRSCGKSRRRE